MNIKNTFVCTQVFFTIRERGSSFTVQATRLSKDVTLSLVIVIIRLPAGIRGENRDVCGQASSSDWTCSSIIYNIFSFSSLKSLCRKCLSAKTHPRAVGSCSPVAQAYRHPFRLYRSFGYFIANVSNAKCFSSLFSVLGFNLQDT